MLAFVTSLRAQALARDWDYHVWLLERTLDSMLAQTHPDFRIFVVCHEVPEIVQMKHPKVTVLGVGFPPPQRNNDDMCVDKVLKISRGVEAALAARCGYVMIADADDLVSRRLAEFVALHPKGDGWFFEKGYSYCPGTNWLRSIQEFHQRCGTCVIVRAGLLRFDAVPFYRNSQVNTLAAAGHNNYYKVLSGDGAVLEPLPFAGAVYVQNVDSTSRVEGGEIARVDSATPGRSLLRRTLSRFKQAARTLPTLRPLTSSMRQEFTVMHAHDVPHNYRTRAAQI